jgi:hypothetical protein
MKTLHQAVCHDFDDEGGSIMLSQGRRIQGRDLAARVVQVVMDVRKQRLRLRHLAQASYPPVGIALGFKAFGEQWSLIPFETLKPLFDRFPLDLMLWGVHRAVIGSLDDNESASFAGMTLSETSGCLSFELNPEA